MFVYFLVCFTLVVLCDVVYFLLFMSLSLRVVQ